MGGTGSLLTMKTTLPNSIERKGLSFLGMEKVGAKTEEHVPWKGLSLFKLES